MAGKTVLIRRHTAATRVTHWLNVLVVAVMLMSGLQIFNAHPALYWGAKSTFDRPWLVMSKVEIGDAPHGVTKIGSHVFDTTGLFGWSGKAGMREQRGFPSWATIPSYRSLADGRRWHFFFAWIFVVNGLAYWLFGLAGGHIRRDILPARDQLGARHIWHEVVTHAQFKFPRGDDARRYNVIQKATYLAMIAVVLPLMVLTGLSMSPGFNAAAPWLIDLFGGRQSARSIHFICAGLIVAFVLVHVLLVLVSGVWNNLRSMVTGKYAIEVEGERA
jgi:thiosulfate reductase cytochrome b subunit